MRNLIDTNKMRKALGIGLLALVLIAIVAPTLATGTDLRSGHWVDSGAIGACPDGQVCAEWDVDGFAVFACCISPAHLGSSNLNACFKGARP